jgi:hypothetical protein
MARDLTVAWEFLTAVARGRQRLASARPVIWEKARLPTAEHTAVLPSFPVGDRLHPATPTETDQIAVRVTLETHLKDGRRVISCLDVVARPKRWRVHPYITLVDRTERSVWQGQPVERDDSTGFADVVDAVAQSLLEATTSLDFGEIEKG